MNEEPCFIQARPTGSLRAGMPVVLSPGYPEGETRGVVSDVRFLDSVKHLKPET